MKYTSALTHSPPEKKDPKILSADVCRRYSNYRQTVQMLINVYSLIWLHIFCKICFKNISTDDTAIDLVNCGSEMANKVNPEMPLIQKNSNGTVACPGVSKTSVSKTFVCSFSRLINR